MKKFHLILVLIIVFVSCDHKKPSDVNGDGIEDIHDFINLFRSVNLPYLFSDTILSHHGADSLVKYRTILRFIPDTVFSAHLGKGISPKIYPLGKIKVAKNETYLLLKAITPARRMVFVLCLDKSNKFITSMPLIPVSNEFSGNWQAGIDNKYTISAMRQHKSGSGQLLYRKWVYVYNDAGVFTLILTESNETNPKNLQVINPIDTLAHRHKFSGDYIQDKRNFVSVRDGKNNSYILFFVHFEKDNGECKGELKGQARFISSSTAQFKSNGDPCMVEFSFGEAGVHMREIEGCGNHRDIKCFFDGYYTKRKEARSRSARKNYK